MKHRVYDEVIIEIEDTFGYTDKHKTQLKVMIVGYEYVQAEYQYHYLCYVPSYVTIPYGFPTFKINGKHARHYNIDPKFIDDLGCFITEATPILKKIEAMEGEKCANCGEFVQHVAKTGEFYVCRACRENPYR